MIKPTTADPCQSQLEHFSFDAATMARDYRNAVKTLRLEIAVLSGVATCCLLNLFPFAIHTVPMFGEPVLMCNTCDWFLRCGGHASA